MKCAICGNEFKPKYRETKTCSRQCANVLISRSKKKGEYRTCESCGEPFYVPAWHMKDNPRFCSGRCYGDWKSLHATGQANSNWRGKTAPRPCVICGKVFTPRARTSKTCSKECESEAKGRSNRGENSYQWTGGEDRECPACGKIFHVPRPSFKKVYCSKSCAAKNRISVSQKKLFAILRELLDDPDLTMEKTWDWLRFPETNRHMYVDIYSPKHNLAVEYDGAHHVTPAAFRNGHDGLKLVQRRDAAKNQLLESHGIRLVRYTGSVTRPKVEAAVS